MTQKAPHVRVRADLLESDRAHGVNVSTVPESALRDTPKHRRQRQWQEESRAAIATYNDFVTQRGVFSSVLNPDAANS